MSRVVTASEVDRLHQQVAELQGQVASLNQTVYAQQQQHNELQKQMTELTSAKSAHAPLRKELFEELVEPGPRSVADNIVDEIAGD